MTYTILSCTNIFGGSYDNYQLIIAYIQSSVSEDLQNDIVSSEAHS